MSALGIIGVVAYGLIGLFSARIIGRALYYADTNPSWEDFVSGLIGGMALGAAWGLWALPALFMKLCKGDSGVAARAVFGEPQEIKDHRILEGKVRMAERTRELEAKLGDGL